MVDIKEYLLRIKDYLGDGYISCEYLNNDNHKWTKVKLSEEINIEANFISIGIKFK